MKQSNKYNYAINFVLEFIAGKGYYFNCKHYKIPSFNFNSKYDLCDMMFNS